MALIAACSRGWMARLFSSATAAFSCSSAGFDPASPTAAPTIFGTLGLAPTASAKAEVALGWAGCRMAVRFLRRRDDAMLRLVMLNPCLSATYWPRQGCVNWVQLKR